MQLRAHSSDVCCMQSTPVDSEPEGPQVVSHSQVSAADCLHWAPITDLQWLPGFRVPRALMAGVTDRPPTVCL